MKSKLLKNEWIHFAEYASISVDNKISISGIFDEIKAFAMPAFLPKFYMAGLFKGSSNTEYICELEIISPSGKVLAKSPGPQLKTGKEGKINVIINVDNLNFSELGIYKFYILSNNKILLKTELLVSQFKNEK